MRKLLGGFGARCAFFTICAALTACSTPSSDAGGRRAGSAASPAGGSGGSSQLGQGGGQLIDLGGLGAIGEGLVVLQRE
jgi:hypothetical protein